MAKVIIADDDPFLIKIYSTRLRQEGHEVITCYDGQTALQQIKEHQPDLAVLDIMMPRLHGLDVLHEMRQDKKLKKIPVIFFSNLTNPDDRKEAEELEASEFLEKAKLTPSQVIAAIHKYIDEKPIAAVVANQEAQAAKDAKEAKPAKKDT